MHHCVIQYQTRTKPTNMIIKYELKFLPTLAGNLLVSLNRTMFNGLVSLKHLTLTNNKIMTVEHHFLAVLPKLKQLDLSGNSIHDMDTDIFGAQITLWSLNLAGNNMKNISENVLDKLLHIMSLNLTNNKLIICQHSPHHDGYNLQRFTKVISLDLRANDMHEIYTDCLGERSSLLRLQLGHNKVSLISQK